MNIVNSYVTESKLLDDPGTLANRCKFLSYPIDTDVLDCVKNMILPGKTTFMFSGSWRLDFDATYLELKMFKNANLEFHKSTLFVEPENPALYRLVLNKLLSTNLVILHSDYWVHHQTVDQLVDNLDQLLEYVPAGGQVICTVPFVRVHFNRLTTTYKNVLEKTNGQQINNSIVIVRKK
jgi:hypothetical protein